VAKIAVGLAVSIVASYVSALLFTPKSTTARQDGSRLSDLATAKTDYGSPISKIYGRARVGGILMWARPIREVVATSTQGGGGKKRPQKVQTTTYTYFGTCAYLLCEGTVYLRRLWINNRLVYDVRPEATTSVFDTSVKFFADYCRFRTGATNQPIDSAISATQGAYTPAFRRRSYLVFEELPLEEYGNRLPVIQAEVVDVSVGSIVNGRVQVSDKSVTDILLDLCARAGISSQFVDVSALVGLNSTIEGFVLGGNNTLRDAIENLSRSMSFFAFEAIESNGKIKFIRRLQASVAKNINFTDLATYEYGSDRPFEFEETDTPEDELPAEVSLTYQDVNFDYQPRTVYARRSTLTGRNTISVSLYTPTNEQTAWSAANHILYWLRRTRKQLAFTLPPTHLDLEAGDVIRINQIHGDSRLYMLTRVDIGANFLVSCEAVSYLEPL